MLAVVRVRFRLERNHLREVGSRQLCNHLLDFDVFVLVGHQAGDVRVSDGAQLNRFARIKIEKLVAIDQLGGLLSLELF